MTATLLTICFVVALTGISTSNADPKYVDLDSFDIDQCVEVYYTAPSTGVSIFHLSDTTNGEIVLSVSYRKNWGTNPSTGEPWQNLIVLNSKVEGEWGTEEHVEDIQTTPGTEMAYVVCTQEKEYSITLNRKEVATFAYRLPVTNVNRVDFNTEYDSTLLKLSVVYSKSV